MNDVTDDKGNWDIERMVGIKEVERVGIKKLF